MPLDPSPNRSAYVDPDALAELAALRAQLEAERRKYATHREQWGDAFRNVYDSRSQLRSQLDQLVEVHDDLELEAAHLETGLRLAHDRIREQEMAIRALEQLAKPAPAGCGCAACRDHGSWGSPYCVRVAPGGAA